MIWVSRPRKRSTRAASHGVDGAGIPDPDPDPGADDDDEGGDDPGVDPGGKVARILAVEEGYARACWIRRRRELV
jgi:hypothetical protein